jgi:hypothetical protein
MTSATVPAAQEASGIVLAANIAEVVIACAILVLAGLGIIAFVQLNRLLRDVRSTTSRHLGPVSDRAKVISDNLEFITQALRQDVEKLSDSVQALTDRLHLASERMEDRIEEFNALMEVVQGEAEEMFLDTASTVRGVREGARAITERAHERPDRRKAQKTSEGSSAAAEGPDGERELERSASELEAGSSAD